MKVVIFNVGGALSSYVETKTKKIIVDLGKSSDFSPVNDFLLPLFKKKNEKSTNGKYQVDQLILSHPHLDHISDLENFDKHFYPILYTTPNDLSPKTDEHMNVNWDLVDDPESNPVKKLRALFYGRQLPLRVCEPTRMTIGYIYPGQVENNDTLTNESYTNNISIGVIIRSTYSIFFAGDIQKEGMKVFLDENPSVVKQLSEGIDFLVTPHHGLRSSFSTDLFSAMKKGKTKRLNIVSEKVTCGPDDKRQVDSRYSTSDYCDGNNNLSTQDSPVYQRKTSNGHIFIDDDGKITIETDINQYFVKNLTII